MSTAFRDICICKHCGRYLDGEDQALAISIGLDADECVEQARCFSDSVPGGSPVIDACSDLWRFRDWLMTREADYLTRLYAEDPNADSKPSASDLFSRESLASAARW